MSRPQKPPAVRRGIEEVAAYEVGYGRPPVASRFQPGQCGNPKGRPARRRASPRSSNANSTPKSLSVREVLRRSSPSARSSPVSLLIALAVAT